MKNAPDLKALLCDDVTRAVLRADALPMADFEKTLAEAAARIERARRPRPSSCMTSPRSWAALPFSLASCGA